MYLSALSTDDILHLFSVTAGAQKGTQVEEVAQKGTQHVFHHCKCTVAPQACTDCPIDTVATCISDNRPLLPAVPPQPPITNQATAEAEEQLVTQKLMGDTSLYRKSWVTCWPTYKGKRQCYVN